MAVYNRRRNTWTAIVLTCQNKTSAHTFQRELEIHQNKGFIDKDVLLLTLEDPKARVGSGGATVNALLVVAEHLSAKAGFETLTLSVLAGANILIMHMGRDFPFSSCGRFFNTLPAKHTEESKEHLCDALVSNFDLLLHFVSSILSVDAPPGVWVCSTDMIISVASHTRLDWQQFSDGITMMLFQGDLEYAREHGVVKLGKEEKFKGPSTIWLAPNMGAQPTNSLKLCKNPTSIPDKGMNSDLEGFDGKEDASELDAVPREPAIFFVDEDDERILIRTINIVEEGEVTQASGTFGRPSNVSVDGLQWSSEDSDMEVPSFIQGKVQDILFKGTDDQIKSCALDNGKIPLVSGVVYFNTKTAERILSLYVFAPLYACTYYGLDNGADPIQLSLFFDILLCLAENITESAFVDGERSGSYGRSTRMGTKCHSKDEMMMMRAARSSLWKALRGLTLRGAVIENGEFDYMQPSAECYRRQMLTSNEKFDDAPFDFSRQTHVCLNKDSQEELPTIDPSVVLVNSIIEGSISIGKESVVSHCHLQGNANIGTGCVLTGISPRDFKGITLAKDLCIIGFNVSLPGLRGKSQRALVVFGVYDQLQMPSSSPSSTYCNKPWIEFFEGTGINPEEVWIGVPEHCRSLWNAKLFSVVHPFDARNEDGGKDDIFWLAIAGASEIPDQQKINRWRSSLRLSLKDITSAIDTDVEFGWKKKLWFEIGRTEVENTLRTCSSNCILPFFKSCAKEGFEAQILEVLDKVASTTSSPGVAARTLACVADVLGAMAGERAGLRSGPARNESWMHAFDLLYKGEIAAGVKALASERSKWLDRPDLLIRAARHYEGAEQVLRRQAVLTASEFFHTEPCEPIPLGHWVTAEAPARIDLSGGWSDTPPLTYEQGGAVLNVAIKLNGQKVTKAQVRKTEKLEIVLVIHSSQSEDHSVRIVCNELTDLENYTQPNAPGALLKACLCFLDIVTLSSKDALVDQLSRKYQAGFELHTWSTAPQGSGLGTSSILAGVILAALLRVTSRTASLDSLIHSVLIVEQMITTGGGWQDNVGGLVPGFKIARSQASLPLKVETEKLELSEKTVEEFNKRIVGFYTGRTRLAKNLLQNVIRNWYARFPQITNNARNLISNAETAAAALKEGNLEKFGTRWTCYRHQKSLMAPGSEPKEIKDLLEALNPLSFGHAMAGAGGGGFIFVLTKEPSMVDKVKAAIKEIQSSVELAFYDVSVDWDGLTVRVEPPSQ